MKETQIKRAIVQISLVYAASFAFFFWAGLLAFGKQYLPVL